MGRSVSFSLQSKDLIRLKYLIGRGKFSGHSKKTTCPKIEARLLELGLDISTIIGFDQRSILYRWSSYENF